jgi:HupE / UreJ protein
MTIFPSVIRALFLRLLLAVLVIALSASTGGAQPLTAADQPQPSAGSPAATPSTPATSESATPGAHQPLPATAPVEAEPAEQNLIWAFLRIGFTHIIPEGLDHILFVLGLFLLAPRLKPLLIQVTAFTVAHSITLGLCMAEIVQLDPRVVETTIAASIAFVAIENICYKELKPWRWIVVFCFGLIHGLGFASALKELGLPKGNFFSALISFNVGVELGQLTVIAVAAALTVWFWKKPWYRTAIVIPCSVIIAGVGLFWAVQRALGYG